MGDLFGAERRLVAAPRAVGAHRELARSRHLLLEVLTAALGEARRELVLGLPVELEMMAVGHLLADEAVVAEEGVHLRIVAGEVAEDDGLGARGLVERVGGVEQRRQRALPGALSIEVEVVSSEKVEPVIMTLEVR